MTHECKPWSMLYLHLHSAISPLVEDHRSVLLQDTILHQVSEVVVCRGCYMREGGGMWSAYSWVFNFPHFQHWALEEVCACYSMAQRKGATSLMSQPLPSALLLLRNSSNTDVRGWRARLGCYLQSVRLCNYKAHTLYIHHAAKIAWSDTTNVRTYCTHVYVRMYVHYLTLYSRFRVISSNCTLCIVITHVITVLGGWSLTWIPMV